MAASSFPPSDRSGAQKRRPGHAFFSALLGSYATRILLALSVSLGVLLALTHAPLYRLAPRSGWFHSSYQTEEPIPLEALHAPSEAGETAEEQARLGAAARATADPGAEAHSERGNSEGTQPEGPPATHRSDVVQRAAVLDPAHAPRVAGGFSQFYMRIHYPEEARRQGIQGKLLLGFTVQKDGQATDIRVVRSLHPLCDSAAVRSLRATRFVPGTRDGEAVRARMRLPVTFKLVNLPSQSADSVLATNQ